jgi:hypothetical protein
MDEQAREKIRDAAIELGAGIRTALSSVVCDYDTLFESTEDLRRENARLAQAIQGVIDNLECGSPEDIAKALGIATESIAAVPGTAACNYCGSKCIDRERFPGKEFCNECERLAAENQEEELPQRYRDLLCHSLGTNSLSPGYRNRFCAEIDSPAYPILCEMVQKGLMSRGHEINDGRDMYFHATRKGALAIGLSEDALFRAGLHYKANA